MYTKKLNAFVASYSSLLNVEPSKKKQKTAADQSRKIRINDLARAIATFVQKETLLDNLTTRKLAKRAHHIANTISDIGSNLPANALADVQAVLNNLHERLVQQFNQTTSFRQREGLIAELQGKQPNYSLRQLYIQTGGQIHIVKVKVSDTLYYLDLNQLKEKPEFKERAFYQQARGFYEASEANEILDLSDQQFAKEIWEETLDYLEGAHTLEFKEGNYTWPVDKARAMALCSHYVGFKYGVSFASLSLVRTLPFDRKKKNIASFDWLTPELYEVMSQYSLTRSKGSIREYFSERIKFLKNLFQQVETSDNWRIHPVYLALCLIGNKLDVTMKLDELDEQLDILESFLAFKFSIAFSIAIEPPSHYPEKGESFLAMPSVSETLARLIKNPALSFKAQISETVGNTNYLESFEQFCYFDEVLVRAKKMKKKAKHLHLPSLLQVPQGIESQLKSLTIQDYYSHAFEVSSQILQLLTRHPSLQELTLKHILSSFEDIPEVSLPSIKVLRLESEHPTFNYARLSKLFPNAETMSLGFTHSFPAQVLQNLLNMAHLKNLTFIHTFRKGLNRIPDTSTLDLSLIQVPEHLKTLTLRCNRGEDYRSNLSFAGPLSLFAQVKELSERYEHLTICLSHLGFSSCKALREAYPNLAIANLDEVQRKVEEFIRKLNPNEKLYPKWHLTFKAGVVEASWTEG